MGRRSCAAGLAKLTEKGLLRPSFVPPAEIRRLRDYTRLREDLTRERSRYWQRLEKLLEDALIKVSVVASRLDTMSTRDMSEALIAGERDARRLAELARMLLNQSDALSAQINTLSRRIEDLITELPEAAAVDHGGGDDTTPPHPTQVTDPMPGTSQLVRPDSPAGRCLEVNPTIEAECARLSVLERLDEITGVGKRNPQVIIAEIGLGMTRFPTPGHPVAWAKLCPRTI